MKKTKFMKYVAADVKYQTREKDKTTAIITVIE